MDPISLIQAIPGIGPYLPYIPVIIAVGAAISTVLPAPTPTTNGAYKALYWVVNWCALNVGHGTNLSSPSNVGIVGGPGAITAPRVSTASVPAAAVPQV